MRSIITLLALSVASCLMAVDAWQDDGVLAELNREELAAAKRWEDVLVRKREMARDQGNDHWEAALEERNLEEYLANQETYLEKRQTADSCIQGDIIFIVDSSGSIGAENWKLVLSFINEAIKRMDVGAQKTRIGMVTYGNRAHIIFHLNNFTSAAQMEPLILGAKWLDENTNTSGGIYVASKIMATAANGERPKAPNMYIIITDGESTYDHDKTVPYANEAKASGTLIISIGVGDKITQAELDGMASTGGDGKLLVFRVGGYDMLKQIQDSLATVACDPIATQPPPTQCAQNNDIPPKDCTAVTCKNKCQYGFESDKDGCLLATCACLLKPVDCSTAAPVPKNP